MIEPFRCQKPEKIVRDYDVEIKEQIRGIQREGYCFQEKIDGANAVVEVELPIVKIFHARWDMKNAKNSIFTNRAYRYPDLVQEIREGKLRNHAVYIGELTVNNEQGVGKQRMLMKRQVEGWKITQLAEHLPVLFYPHHIIQADGQSLHDLSYEQVLRLLGSYVNEGKHVKIIPTFNTPEPLLERQNIEGVVVKNLSGTYQFGKRGCGWTKAKFLHEETVKFISYTVKDVGINLFTDENFEVHLAGDRVPYTRILIDQNGFTMAELEYLEKTPTGYRDCSIKRIGELSKVEL